MSFTAEVENDTIKLPPGMHLPNGTKVTVEPEKKTNGDQTESLWSFMDQFAGCIDTGLGDVAENHDHYAHGAPKGVDGR